MAATNIFITLHKRNKKTDNIEINSNMAEEKRKTFIYQGFLKQTVNWKDLRFYQKSEVLYHLTYVFCKRYLSTYGDRTVDQMVQSARSGKQNIVEGSEDGLTSTSMEIHLINIARSSIGELRQDYLDYLKSRHLHLWTQSHERYQPMQNFTRCHNQLSDYEVFFQKWSAEEMCNTAITLCHQVDTMMNRYIKVLEQKFVSEGGIKERMHKARTRYRQQQDKEYAEMKRTIPLLESQLQSAQEEIIHWKSAYADLKARALKSYYNQQEEISDLKEQILKLQQQI